jgi:hypothetical protein
MAQLLQGWANHISFCADHTYVACPDAGDEFFDCWGEPSRTGPDRMLICSGEGNYPVANCYRCSWSTRAKYIRTLRASGYMRLTVSAISQRTASCLPRE